MLIGIDHLVDRHRRPRCGVGRLRDRLGIEAGGGGVHPGAGTANRLAWFGDTYLELIDVTDRVAAAASLLGGPTIRVLDERGAGFVTLRLASDDLDADVARLRSAGSTMGDPFAGERRRPDGRSSVGASPSRALSARPRRRSSSSTTDGRRMDVARTGRAGAATHPIGGTVRLTALEIRGRPIPVAATEAYREAVGHPPGRHGSGEGDGSRWS